MHVEFHPRSNLMQRLNEGWRLVNGHDYRPDDWAILMHLPAAPVPAPEAIIRHARRTFMGAPSRATMSNRSAAQMFTNMRRWANARQGEAVA